MWIVELEKNVWLAYWTGDPGRTCVRQNAQVYLTWEGAMYALSRARHYREFPCAAVVPLNFKGDALRAVVRPLRENLESEYPDTVPDVHRYEHENGAVSTIPISGNNEEGSSLIWNLIWVKPVADETRYHAAGVIETFEYLLSGHLTANQACKRLRELRRVRAELCKEI